MTDRTKIFAMYLPQYHEIPENSEFWGEGFTDWVGVKKASPLYKGHIEPREPESGYYYDLSKKEDVAWQVSLAKEYGIDGFGIYHYWFNDEKNLLTKPAEIILNNRELDLPFFFAWDNGSWKRTWSKISGGNDWAPLQDKEQKKDGPVILIPYELGGEKEWENHFNWLLPFFKDSRYEKPDNKPLFLIYNYSSDLLPMVEFWNDLAVKNGFNGIRVIFRHDKLKNIPAELEKFNYEPQFSGWNSFYRRLKNKIYKTMGITKTKIYSYDKIWKKILRGAKKYGKDDILSGAFVSYDDTPRRGENASIVKGDTPSKFENYLKRLADISKENGKEYIFLTAWNEWGEGAKLEPDKTFGREYLAAVKRVKESQNK